MVRKKIFWSTAALVVAVDQISKVAVNYLQPTFQFLHPVHNTGAGFGLFPDGTIFLAAISLLVAFVVILFHHSIPANQPAQLMWGLFLGGVIGNLIDRVLRGSVIDFIDLQIWPVFNIADSAITIAVAGLVYWYWKEGKE